MNKNKVNLIYILLNLLYIIPGTFCALFYYNFFYNIFEEPVFSREIENIIGILILIPYAIFYIMGLTFTILLHPIAQIIIFFLFIKNKIISKIYIIIVFIFSIAIAFTYLYLIWGKGLILTV
jgi:hypothetical protein